MPTIVPISASIPVKTIRAKTIPVKTSPVKAMLLVALGAVLAACTPDYVKQGGHELATQFRLSDSIDVQRSNPQLLSRHGQVCLVSELAGTEPGLSMLRSMQAAFSGYFVAVGIENEPVDYMRMLAGNSCPGAAYLFYVQPYGESSCTNGGGDQPPLAAGETAAPGTCQRQTYSQLTITIVTGRDRMLLDRIKFSMHKGFLPFGNANDAQQLSQAFERLAAALIGASN